MPPTVPVKPSLTRQTLQGSREKLWGFPGRVTEKPAQAFKGDPEAGRAGKRGTPPALLRKEAETKQAEARSPEAFCLLQRRQSNPPGWQKERRAFWASPTAKEGDTPLFEGNL